ncbi:MAG: hydroxyacid dehydrogenase [Fimbriimonas ginsengisoli]|uniref:Hydroxyacid dehydrogenase n=1 Tax=Fimbriimonas ginsengisoli TaxID=1005039 RepID=A0A931LU46_FIMGI|nr:hydroxyacid dehydrogenase [Fimbriimonas ginsengisoli]MBI3721444.1 hydroxyacid dehydrogenase [Fimbriimonas ginsengisoli]
MKVLVADKFEKSGLDGLKSLGCEVVSEPDLQSDAIGARLVETGAEILIVRGTKVPESAMAGTKAKLIIRAGSGYNTIDVDAASRMGIQVANCPGKNAQAVAELAFGLILACDRHIPDNVADLRAGRWNKKAYSKARGLYGRTLGLIGMGQVGREMVDRAKAFGMLVLAFTQHLPDDEVRALGAEKVGSLAELASRSDVVSVHVSLRPDTKAMLGEAFFSFLRPGAIFVNTSRGEVVDQSALLAAVESGGLLAGLDVFDNEPTTGEGEYDGPLRSAKGVYCTHHIGAATEQAQEAVAAETVRIVAEFMRTGVAPNVVNLVAAGV